MKVAPWLFFLCTFLLCSWAWGQQGGQSVDADRLFNLTSQLRCLVCQNESLADSNAPLAMDLKKEIRSQMAEGKTDDQIKGFLVERYGNFVLYRPPLTINTLVLWLGPLLLLVIGALVIWKGVLGRGAPVDGLAVQPPAPPPGAGETAARPAEDGALGQRDGGGAR